MRCDGWPAKNKYIFFFHWWSLGVSRTQSRSCRLCLYNNVLRRGVCTKPTPHSVCVCCCTHFWHSARAQNTYKCRMETHTMEHNPPRARALSVTQHLFISQYYCFRPATRHQVAVKFAFCVTQQLCGRRFRPILLVN